MIGSFEQEIKQFHNLSNVVSDLHGLFAGLAATGGTVMNQEECRHIANVLGNIYLF